MSPSTARHVLGCGFAMLIPIPWLDEYVERRLTRAMYRDLAGERGVVLADVDLDALTEDRSSMVAGCLYAAVKWPVKKLFRTVVYFLTLKDVLDAVTRAAHRASMLAIALDAGALPGRAREVRALMDMLLARYRTSPVSRTLWLQERPALEEAPASSSQAVTLVHWFQKHGGGGLVLPEFRARIAEVSR